MYNICIKWLRNFTRMEKVTVLQTVFEALAISSCSYDKQKSVNAQTLSAKIRNL